MEAERTAAGIGPSSLDSDASFLLARASAVAAAAGNGALAGLGLKVRSYSVLALAVECSPTQRGLAAHLRLDPSQIVALVDDLESRGLVHRRPVPSDRRTRTVEATAQGVSLFTAARAAVRSVERAVHSSLSEAEVDVLRGLLLRIAYSDLT
ncbi:MarR family winged helix-turn-helix transcriptional regulator [Demequina soli]|uniref:MarR family winged helix-turn-helix transcriptional regulator n=1 Tax=Demequina soli TaxID=1638987 RepID=UPI0007841302|nr:MarR family winged helix-turn-helix transcriptional regulator [Demequina soli]